MSCGRSVAFALWALHRHVLVRRGVGEQRDPAEARLSDARSDAVDEGKLPDRSVDRALDHQLLNLEENGFAPGALQFARLLLVERVDVRVAAVGEDAALHEVGLDAGRGISECARAGLDDVPVLLFAE